MKYKFTKFGYSLYHGKNITLKEQYILALHDPAYLLLLICILLVIL